MSEDFGIAPPPFHPEQAAQKARREWRDWGLTEREGVFERQGLAFAAIDLANDGAALNIRWVSRPSRHSPQWQSRAVNDHAALRQIQAELRKRLSAWTDRDD